MSSTSPSPSINQSRNKGKKQAGGEAPNNAANLNLNEPVIDEEDQGDASAKNKGKEIMMVEERPPNPSNKRKAIVLGGPDDHHPHDDHFGSKNPRTVSDPQDPGEQNSSPPSLQEAIGNDDRPKKNNAPSSYNCDFCDKSFGSPQALGGHQNAHKLERHLRYGIERGSSVEPLPPSQPILNPVNMDQLHNNNNNPMMMNAMTMRNGNQHDVPINGSFHEAGNNSAPYHPQWNVAGFGTGLIGAMEIGNYGGFHHPYQGPWLNHGYENGYNAGGFRSFGALDPGYAAFYYPEGAWFNPGYETGYNIGGTGYYDPFQQPELAWMNHGGMGTRYYGGVHNTYGLHGQIDDEAYDPQLQQSATPSGITEFVWLPIRDGDYHQNTGTTQQVGVEIDDFGLVPKEYGDEDTESLQEEAIDLTLKL